ncbi:hypothetical protein GGX14DRAFT_391839 [Mycena pura]|uniref:Uncharacterized protein n=1 Tax=Mycena pura TaxID=153505 RepID=A0AAD6VLL7_9AGAR|nr:hypothetical protein GGX14DRAFT_391839 [Mycena pura]
MGPRKKDASDREQLVARIAEQDAEIEHLKISLAAHVGSSARLAAALDTLDDVRQQHAEELAEEARVAERLRDRLARYRDVVRVSEVERDNLRDAVVELAERIESSQDDFSSLPHPRIRIPNLLNPLQPPHELPAGDTDRDLWAYASAVIISMRTALAAEERAHAETRRTARARIALMEARLARREAELEALTTLHRARSQSSQRHSAVEGSAGLRRTAGTRTRTPSPPALRDGELATHLAQTEAHNALLAAEVAQLAARLEQRRNHFLSSHTDEVERLPAHPRSSDEPLPIASRHQSHSHDREQQRVIQSSSPSHTSHHPPRSSSPSLPRSSPDRDNPARGRDDPDTVDQDRTIRPAVRTGPQLAHSTSRERSSAGGNTVDGFAREVRELGKQIDALHVLREQERQRSPPPDIGESPAPNYAYAPAVMPAEGSHAAAAREAHAEAAVTDAVTSAERRDMRAALAREVAVVGAQVAALRLVREHHPTDADRADADVHGRIVTESSNSHAAWTAEAVRAESTAAGTVLADTDDMHDALAREISALGDQVDALISERTVLWEQVRAAQREDFAPEEITHVPTSLQEHMQPSSSNQGEAEKQAVQHGTHQLHRRQPQIPGSAATSPDSPPRPTTARSRNPGLLVFSPRPTSRRHPTPEPAPQPPSSSYSGPSYSPPQLLDDSDGERSMELATPLVPSVILSAFAGSGFAGPTLLPMSGPSPTLELSPVSPSVGLSLSLSAAAVTPPSSNDGGEQAVQELMGLASARRRRITEP